jgi:hypothetical protein
LLDGPWAMAHTHSALKKNIKKITAVIFVFLVLDGPWVIAHMHGTLESNIKK